ncbi:UNVERIFIED_CONTAM: hypothetical protein FKN15_075268 [Acipenser sinensis]
MAAWGRRLSDNSLMEGWPDSGSVSGCVCGFFPLSKSSSAVLQGPASSEQLLGTRAALHKSLSCAVCHQQGVLEGSREPTAATLLHQQRELESRQQQQQHSTPPDEQGSSSVTVNHQHPSCADSTPPTVREEVSQASLSEPREQGGDHLRLPPKPTVQRRCSDSLGTARERHQQWGPACRSQTSHACLGLGPCLQKGPGCSTALCTDAGLLQRQGISDPTCRRGPDNTTPSQSPVICVDSEGLGQGDMGVHTHSHTHCRDSVLGHRGKAEDAANWRIVLGKHRLKRSEMPERVFGVQRIYRHERFRYPLLSELDYDITLVKANRGKENVSLAESLNQARLPIIDFNTCRQKKFWGNRVRDSMICAGFRDTEGPPAACQGDSGGPLLCQLGRDRWEVHGVVSFGPIGCTVENKPSVFTRTSTYIPWIEATRIRDFFLH